MFVAFATDGPTLLSMVAASGSIFAEMPSIFGSFFFKDRAYQLLNIKIVKRHKHHKKGIILEIQSQNLFLEVQNYQNSRKTCCI